MGGKQNKIKALVQKSGESYILYCADNTMQVLDKEGLLKNEYPPVNDDIFEEIKLAADRGKFIENPPEILQYYINGLGIKQRFPKCFMLFFQKTLGTDKRTKQMLNEFIKHGFKKNVYED